MNETIELQAHLTIRRCAEHDLPELEWFGLFTPHRQIIQESFRRQERDENLMLVADLNGFPVAQVWIDLERPHRGHVGLLWALRVIPCLQRLGIGKKMVAAAEHVLAQRGYEEAEISAEKGSPAGDLYRRLGYHYIGDRSEQVDYTTPEGEEIQEAADQWGFRKNVRPAASA